MSTLMVMAGGTGGHVYPAMAVADHLKAKGWHIVWLATAGGIENQLIAGKGYEVATIHMSGVRGKGLLRWASLPKQLWNALMQSRQVMKKFSPDVVLGMGGFAAFPGGVVAWLMRRPLVIHEQNSIAGLTNRVLSRIANRVLAAFPSAFPSKAKVVGNPVRQDIAAVATPEERFFGRTGPLRLLVVGGSLGAQALNEIVPQALALMPETSRPRVIHQAGSKHIGALAQGYQHAGVEAETRAFLDNMAEMYAWCDLVICRAGALTIAEVAAAGVASLLVPYPHAVDDHQTFNALFLTQEDAAVLLPQAQLTPQRLKNLLTGFTRTKLEEMAQKARSLGQPEATLAVANVCEELAHAA